MRFHDNAIVSFMIYMTWIICKDMFEKQTNQM